MENGNVMALMRERYLAMSWLDRSWLSWGNALCRQLEWLDSVLSPIEIFIADRIPWSRPRFSSTYTSSGPPAVLFFPLAMSHVWCGH